MNEWDELKKELGTVVEAIGRHLQRRPPHTYENLTDLRDALNHAAKTVKTIRDNTTVRY